MVPSEAAEAVYKSMLAAVPTPRDASSNTLSDYDVWTCDVSDASSATRKWNFGSTSTMDGVRVFLTETFSTKRRRCLCCRSCLNGKAQDIAKKICDAHNCSATSEVVATRNAAPMKIISNPRRHGKTSAYIASLEQEAARSKTLSRDFAELRKIAERMMGDHNAPDGCYSSGPMTGNTVEDTSCPSCELLAFLKHLGAAHPAQQQRQPQGELGKGAKIEQG